MARGGGFFGDHGDVRGELGEGLQDNRFGGIVGFGHRGRIGLLAHGRTRAVLAFHVIP